MTLEELKKLDKAVITPCQAAGVIGCDPQFIRTAARQHPEWLGFPVIVYGSRTKIPRLPFIRYIEGETGGARA